MAPQRDKTHTQTLLYPSLNKANKKSPKWRFSMKSEMAVQREKSSNPRMQENKGFYQKNDGLY